MRFHVVSLPHTNTTDGFSSCAYTTKVRKFCKMMMDRGHEVCLYSGEFNETPCTMHFICIDEESRLKVVGDNHYVAASFNYTLPHWTRFNENAIIGIKAHIQPKDFICLIAGFAQKQIADAFPGYMSVEFGIGYGGSFSNYRVFESYAWMHMTYGAQAKNLHSVIGNAFHTVIPNYLDPDEFPFQSKKQDYFMYLGRITDLKGYDIAIEACKIANKKLVLAGPNFDNVKFEYGEYVGEIGPVERARLLGSAKALFVPTKYIEPFGTVAIEAMMCGTPVITSDWGAFTETVRHGSNGFRCRTLNDYINAIQFVEQLHPTTIRKKAIELYSLRMVGKKYEHYFKRLNTLWDKGWYQLEEAA